MKNEVTTHTSASGREDLRANAASALLEAEGVPQMLICGQILALLDDIDILIRALTENGIAVRWQGEEIQEPRLGSNLRPLVADMKGKENA